LIQEIQRLLNDYLAWLKDRTVLRQIDNWLEITTPYLDRHNDYVQIYAKKSNGGFVLTDDGYTIDDLEQSGCKLALEVHARPENFALRKHNLVQAVLAVNDMFYLAGPTVANLFYEDVAAWLDLHDIHYTPNVKFTGKSGYDCRFDFVIPKSRQQPERILKAVNRASRDTAEAVAFSWIDTKEVRPPDSRAYALLNDAEQSVSPSIVDALSSYEVRPVRWRERESVRVELAA
jgi:hypothetical protein